jgi:hypothetical protein
VGGLVNPEPFFVNLLCLLCVRGIGSDGVYISADVRFCRRCALRVIEVMELELRQSPAISSGRRS